MLLPETRNNYIYQPPPGKVMMHHARTHHGWILAVPAPDSLPYFIIFIIIIIVKNHQPKGYSKLLIIKYCIKLFSSELSLSLNSDLPEYWKPFSGRTR